MEKLKTLPLPGYRIIKTAVGVFLCLLCYMVIERDGVSLAVIATVICMKDSVEKSISSGINRVMGTLLGGVFAALFVLLGVPYMSTPIAALFISFGVALFIYISILFNKKQSIDMGCIVFLIIMIDVDVSDNVAIPLIYCINRTIDTLIGIIIAIVINRFLAKPTVKSKKDTDGLLKYEIHRKEQRNSIDWNNWYKGIIEPVKASSVYTLNTNSHNSFFVLEDRTTITITYDNKEHTEILNRNDFFTDSAWQDKDIEYKIEFSNESEEIIAIRVDCFRKEYKE